MVKKSAYKSLLKIAIVTLAIIIAIVVVLRGTGYWKSDFDRVDKTARVVE